MTKAHYQTLISGFPDNSQQQLHPVPPLTEHQENGANNFNGTSSGGFISLEGAP